MLRINELKLPLNHAEGDLVQAILASPMFMTRWRWNLTRSLAILRFQGGRKTPMPIQSARLVK